MTLFDILSLILSGVADFIALGALAAAIVGGVIANKSLKAVLDQLRGDQWSTLLSLEQEMESRRQKVDELDSKLMSLPPGNPDLNLLSLQLAARRESYFNAIDRLASMVLNGQFPQEDLKQDYYELLQETIRKYRADFGPGTHYRKVMKLYDKWADGK